MAIPVGKWVDFSVLLFSVSVKVLPVTPLLSGVFVQIIHRIYKKAKFHHILVWAECVMQDLVKKRKNLPFCSGELRPVRQV